MLSWMAWTWPTALVFVGIFSAIAVLIVIEIRSPGGAERRGILGLTTTRGDRLFIALLGSVYIFFGLAWIDGNAALVAFGPKFTVGGVLFSQGMKLDRGLTKTAWWNEVFSI